jgi:ABC-type uncharacterized transport system fused permease/ATPase subunit
VTAATADAAAKAVAEATAAITGGGPQTQTEAITLENVDIVTPSGVCLAQGIDLSIERGHSLMVTGHNATGKSSLFRVLSGLWPLQTGSVSGPKEHVYGARFPTGILHSRMPLDPTHVRFKRTCM